MNERIYQQELVVSAIARGAHTLHDIARECGGIYPGELNTFLKELILRKRIILLSEGYYLTDSSSTMPDNILSIPKTIDGFAELPEPHPHDYDWRFNSSTNQHLINIMIKASMPNGKVLLLGTPSVFIELLYTHKAPHTTLLDWNHSLNEYLSHLHLPTSFIFVEHDLRSGHIWREDDQIDAVLCDPPWYVEHYAAFLVQAACAAKIGAKVAVSLLPPNARPEALTDRWKIYEIAHKLGLQILSVESNTIEYQTPAFEQASLQSASIDIRESWRTGDLAIFSKVAHPRWATVAETLFYATSRNTDTHEWAEVLIGCCKVKLRGPFDDYSRTPELLSIEPDDTLPTVSRRYKGRESIDLWLWNNRVFAVKGKASLLAALYVLGGKPLPNTLRFVTQNNLRQALALLTKRARVTDATTSEVWKDNRWNGKRSASSHGNESGTGTA